MFLTSVFIKNVDHRLTGHFSLAAAIFTNLWYSPECPQGSFIIFSSLHTSSVSFEGYQILLGNSDIMNKSHV